MIEDSFRNKTLLVTGTTGFLGKYISSIYPLTAIY